MSLKEKEMSGWYDEDCFDKNDVKKAVLRVFCNYKQTTESIKNELELLNKEISKEEKGRSLKFINLFLNNHHKEMKYTFGDFEND